MEMGDLTIAVLASALHDIERYEEQLPWVLICSDVQSGALSMSGPFATRAESERVLQHETMCAGHDSTLSFAVAPLYPALDLDGHRDLTIPRDDLTDTA